MFNAFNQDERIMAQYGAALDAVAERFCWLDRQAIENPPHQWFDAYLARQIAVHITCEFFDVPRKRLVAITDRARQRIGEAIGVVEDRRDDDAFEGAYRAMCGRANALYQSRLTEASDV